MSSKVPGQRLESTRRYAALAALAIFLGCGGPARPPDILLIVLDCIRADHVGAFGYARPTTPSIDQVAAEGTVFTHAFAQASWTRPSLPTILTGLYPSEHGLGSFVGAPAGTLAAALPRGAVTLAEALGSAGYATALIAEQVQLSRRFGLGQGFDHYTYRGGTAERINARYLGWLGATSGRPTFAYLHYLDAHWPYCPPATTKGRFVRPDSSLDPCRDWRKLRIDIQGGRRKLAAPDRERLRDRYDEELLALDGRLGELFAALRQKGHWDETLVVITADHGEEFLEHGGVTHGQSLYDELLHVPLVVKPPKSWRAQAGRRVDVLVELRDLFPTLLEAGGARVEPAPAAASLVGHLRGSGSEAPLHAFVVSEANKKVAVRTIDRKLVVYPIEGREEFFDLTSDPGESRNLAKEREEEVAELRGHLRAWRESLRPLAGGPPQVLDEATSAGLRSLGYLN